MKKLSKGRPTHRAASGRFTQSEIKHAFDTLGLSTQEQRDKVLSQGRAAGATRSSEQAYVTKVTNTSEEGPAFRTPK